MSTRSDISEEFAPGLAAHIEQLSDVKLVVLGDAMLDRFIHGRVDRISPEAPIPIFQVDHEAVMLGGAGNVARNLVALGTKLCFISVIGRDAPGREVIELVGREEGMEPYLLLERERQTTVKQRYVAAGQQMLRADRETITPVTHETEERLINLTISALEPETVLILSDYGKGVLTPYVLHSVIAAARAACVPVLIDPKSQDFGLYQGATVLTPNRRELSVASGLPTENDTDIEQAALTLCQKHNLEAMLVTRGAEGISLIQSDNILHLPAQAREVFDVSGAGDTFIAHLAAGMAAGLDLLVAARLANLAAGLVVGKVGTAIIRPAELTMALQAEVTETKWQGDSVKWTMPDQAPEKVALWQRRGLRVGFTNGCFDLLHPGHVFLLQQARLVCDRLVVGLNMDASVRRLKGAGRPVQNESARAMVLAGLAAVDLVVFFAEDTPLSLIRSLRPDVLVKGADYRLDQVVGGDWVQSYGGKVILVPLIPDQSSSRMTRRAAEAMAFSEE